MRYLNSTNIKGLGAGARWLRSWVKSIQHRRPVRIKAVLVFFTFSLAGCGGPKSIYFIGASLANFIHTDRMPIDYIVDYDSGQECNLLKSIEDGDAIMPKTPHGNHHRTTALLLSDDRQATLLRFTNPL